VPAMRSAMLSVQKPAACPSPRCLRQIRATLSSVCHHHACASLLTAAKKKKAAAPPKTKDNALQPQQQGGRVRRPPLKLQDAADGELLGAFGDGDRALHCYCYLVVTTRL
jgi:hypothetical protein